MTPSKNTGDKLGPMKSVALPTHELPHSAPVSPAKAGGCAGVMAHTEGGVPQNRVPGEEASRQSGYLRAASRGK